MPLFNKKIIEQNFDTLIIPDNHLTILNDWQTMIDSKNLAKHKETAIVSAFINKILEIILGYQTIGTGETYNLAQEYKIASGFVDVALGEFFNNKIGDSVHAVFEFKGAKTKNLDAIISSRLKTPVQQAWDYAKDVKDCQWVLVSNYLEIRLYAFGQTSLVYEHFDLSSLTEPKNYARFILCLHAKQLLTGKTKNLLQQSLQAEKEITNKLYFDYKSLRELLISRLSQDNSQYSAIELIAPAQKLLDRILFIAFAEDKGLIPAKSIEKAYQFINPYNPKPIYENFKGLFKAIDKSSHYLGISDYNGGLFVNDKLLDNLIVTNELCAGFLKLAEYDFASEISVTVLGHIFEQSISDLEELNAQIKNEGTFKTSQKLTAVSGKRKQHGVVYTPDHITHFIVQYTLGDYLQQRFESCLNEFATIDADKTIHWNAPTTKKSKYKTHQTELLFLYQWQDILKSIKVLDPACGSGAFLIAAFDVLHHEYQKINDRIAEITGQHGLFDLNKEILNSNLNGVDINSESIEITKLSLWLKTAERGKKLATIDNNVQVGNSLGFDCAVNDGGFCWQSNFKNIMQAGGFDVVLGNPPYVRQELLSDLKTYLQQHYRVYHGVADLYAYFFELALKLLKPNGMLGFISSATFFKTSSGEPLRCYLKEKATLKKVVDFGDLQVFEGVTTYPAILIFQNVKPDENSQIEMLVLKDKLPDKLIETFATQHGVILQSQLNDTSWQFETAQLAQLRIKLTSNFATLKEVYGSPYRGVLTGLNEAFVIDENTKNKLIAQDIKSSDLLKPFLEGKDLKKWHCQPRQLWLIFTRRGTDIEKYPAIKAHLQQYRQRLEPKPANFSKTEKWLGRKEGKYQWFEIQDTIAYYDEFEKTKIIYSHFQSEPVFSIDKSGNYVNCKCYMTSHFDDFLLGLLNSKVIWFIFKSVTTVVRGGFYEAKTQVIETLPIPPATPQQKSNLANLAEQCQTLAEQRYSLEIKICRRLFDLGITKLTQKLERWWLLDFKALKDELKKSYKIELSLKQSDDWDEYLTDNKKTHKNLTVQIQTLENELNALVYQLYALSDEEIVLIENNSSNVQRQ